MKNTKKETDKILFWQKINTILMLCVLVTVYITSSNIKQFTRYQSACALEQTFEELDAFTTQLEAHENQGEAPSTTEVQRAPRYDFTEDDIYLMTVVLCGSGSKDGDGEYDIDFGNRHRDDQISLVLGVIMNRVRSEKFPNTVRDVIWAKNQFSVMPQWKSGLPKVSDESLAIVRDWCERYDNYEKVQDIPEDHLFFKAHGPGGIENISRKGY